MHVLHTIDALHLGGAERMLSQLATETAERGIPCSVCVTREKGPLYDSLPDTIPAYHLTRGHRFAISAIGELRDIIKRHQVTHVHAHSTSIFIVAIATLGLPVCVIWHDHFGGSDNLNQRKTMVYRLIRLKLHGIITVNRALTHWANTRLGLPAEQLLELNNFSTPLKGIEKPLPDSQGKIIVNVANLSEQKNQLGLIEAFDNMDCKECTLWLVGSDQHTGYAEKVRAKASAVTSRARIHLLGARTDIAHVLRHADIGVLASKSEGLPLSLLEYAWAELTTICTDTGQCATVIGSPENGYLVAPQNQQELINALNQAVKSPENRGKNLRARVDKNYSASSALNLLLPFYRKIESIW